MKKKIKGILVKLAIMIAISVIFMVSAGTGERFQYINHLDYQVTLNQDGSMNVTETWDINVNHTNTLVRNFDLSSKYGDITDVRVVDLNTGESLTQIEEEMYHVTKGCYYALALTSHKFEIAWGVGLDDKYANKKYQISYKVSDVITQYYDMQEMYWQFLAKGQNDVPVSKVTGTVTLPQEVSNIDKLRVWGHGQSNGKIEKVNAQKVYFEMSNLNPKAMFEIRVVTEDKMFEVSTNKIRNYHYLDTVLEEETEWADETNEEAKVAQKFLLILGIIYFVIIMVQGIKIIKYRKREKQEGNGLTHKTLQYYREIPREENSTPAEATYLYYFNKKRLETGAIQSKVVASTILNLALKKIIRLRVEEKSVYVKIITEPVGLKKDELEIYQLLKEVAGNQEKFKLDDLKIYAKKKYHKYSEFINKVVNAARNSLYELKLIDKAKEREYTKSESAEMKIMLVKNIYEWLIVTYLVSLLPIFHMILIREMGIGFSKIFLEVLLALFPMVAILLYSWHLQKRVYEKIAVLTQAGSDEKEQWKGLAKYMKEFSLLREKEVPQLVIWEKYLVYATAFGIADKVVEQMKANYPEVFIKEQWDDEKMAEQYPVIYFSANPMYYDTMKTTPISQISKDVNNAYHTSVTEIAAHSSSSGSGGGGGFSGGGGGRRWPVAGMGGR